ncbi:MAG: HTTM domain-containing protein [Pirellulales bacterium]
MTKPNSKSSWIADWFGEATSAWESFWFTPRAPHTLAALRIVTGLMIAYVHLIWLSQVSAFFGPTAWVDGTTNRVLHSGDYSWSYLAYVSDTRIAAAHECLAIAVGLCMAAGFLSRVTMPLAWFLTLMVCHRQTGALFGLDQVVMMSSMYLMFSRAGSAFGVDAKIASVRGNSFMRPSADPAISNNIATRLLQLHLCIVYLFGGISKMRGDQWWEGSAMWWSIANYEYQSLDVTWLGRSPLLIALFTHVTLFWETFYPALVWPRLTRPIVLLCAVLVHGGIALFLGMPTFGIMMIAVNGAFIEPEMTARVFRFISSRLMKQQTQTSEATA